MRPLWSARHVDELGNGEDPIKCANQRFELIRPLQYCAPGRESLFRRYIRIPDSLPKQLRDKDRCTVGPVTEPLQRTMNMSLYRRKAHRTRCGSNLSSQRQAKVPITK